MRGTFFEAELAVEARVDVHIYLFAAFCVVGDIHSLFSYERVEDVALAENLSKALNDDAVGVKDETFALKFDTANYALAFCLFGYGTRKVKPRAVKAVGIFLTLAPRLPLTYRFESRLVEVVPFDRFFTLDNFGF